MTPVTTASGHQRAIRRVVLPDGRRLVLRPVTVEDLEDLVGLFAGLSLGELSRRFWLVSRPDRAALGRAATVGERGGFGLVAVVSDPGGGAERLVGQAGYELLPSGDGELTFVVAPQWRDRLGPFLLHAIIEMAATHGVVNLEGEVQLTNQPMLALARSLGGMFMPSGHPSSVRFVIGTRGAMPTWPGPHDRPRVLVETPSGRWDADRVAIAAGLQILVCPGPRDRRCPALHGQVCALAASADAIVIPSATSDGRWDALMEAHRPQHPGVPVCAKVSTARAGDPGRVVQLDAGDCRADVAVVDLVAREHARRSDGWLGERTGQTTP